MNELPAIDDPVMAKQLQLVGRASRFARHLCQRKPELLEELLAEFAGTLLLVSHDRAFLDAIVTSTIVFESDGGVREYVGGYSDWQRQTTRIDLATASPASGKVRERGAKRRPKDAQIGFKEKQELEGLPDQIEALEASQAALQGRVSEPGFYQQDKAEIQAVLGELNELNQTVERAYQRWEVLQERASTP